MFCRPPGHISGSRIKSGCLEVYEGQVLEVTGEHLSLGPAPDDAEGLSFGPSSHQALSWAAAEANRSCFAEARAKRLMASRCRDRPVVSVTDVDTGEKRLTPCSEMAPYCGRGLEVEAWCPATCGSCSVDNAPAEHFWGRLRGYVNYGHYVGVQRAAMEAKITRQWAQESDIYFLSQYMWQKLEGNKATGFALCHGTRQGLEQRWFREAFAELGWPSLEAWGTEISHLGSQFPYTISPWDFHDVKPDWEGRADFVYSNALDHSYDPPKAIRAWMRSLREDGILLVQPAQEPPEVRDGPSVAGIISDPYQATMAQLQRLILLSGPYEVCDILRRGESAWLVAAREGRGTCRYVS